MMITVSHEKNLPNTSSPGGLCNFISWARLARELQQSGELKSDERLIHVYIQADGITYYVK